ncbi:hypothetical protein K457DRAFT_197829 [Linnemannia elongata AG-77]|uniref:Uncharacterized protein n=1 Tax=Linnemannia elongata AG-77 TaxID=1314771 RepID=A0A197JH18_9FUNG|nr:hypothetical protein K457DRAFT_197829 [Linnemannia elongata AG-77]
MKYEYECVLATSTPCPFFFSFFFGCSRRDILFGFSLALLVCCCRCCSGPNIPIFFFLLLDSFFVHKHPSRSGGFLGVFFMLLASCCTSCHVSLCLFSLFASKKNTLCSSLTPLFPSSPLSFFLHPLGRSKHGQCVAPFKKTKKKKSYVTRPPSFFFFFSTHV